MRVAAYIRSSPQDAFSLKKQHGQILHFCRARNMEIVEVYTDTDPSLAGLSGPGLRGLLDDASRSRFDAVVVSSVDRLSSDQKEFWTIFERLNQNGVSLLSATEPFDTTSPMGKATIESLKVIARLGAAEGLPAKTPMPTSRNLPAEARRELPAEIYDHLLPAVQTGIGSLQRSLWGLRLNLLLIFIGGAVIAGIIAYAGGRLIVRLSSQLLDLQNHSSKSFDSVTQAVGSTRASVNELRASLDQAMLVGSSTLESLYSEQKAALDTTLHSGQEQLNDQLKQLQIMVENVRVAAAPPPAPPQPQAEDKLGSKFHTPAEYFRAILFALPSDVSQLPRTPLNASCRGFLEERAVAAFYGEIDVLYDVPVAGQAVIIQSYDPLTVQRVDSYPDPGFTVFAKRAKSRLASPFRAAYRQYVEAVCRGLSSQVPSSPELYGRIPHQEDNYIALKQAIAASSAAAPEDAISMFNGHYEPAAFGFILIIDEALLKDGRVLAVKDPEPQWLSSGEGLLLPPRAQSFGEATTRGKLPPP